MELEQGKFYCLRFEINIVVYAPKQKIKEKSQSVTFVIRIGKVLQLARRVTYKL